MISHSCRVSHSPKTDSEKRDVRRLVLLHSGIRTADRYFRQRRTREISHFLSSSFANKFLGRISLHIYEYIHPTQKSVFWCFLRFLPYFPVLLVLLFLFLRRRVRRGRNPDWTRRTRKNRRTQVDIHWINLDLHKKNFSVVFKTWCTISFTSLSTLLETVFASLFSSLSIRSTEQRPSESRKRLKSNIFWNLDLALQCHGGCIFFFFFC